MYAVSESRAIRTERWIRLWAVGTAVVALAGGGFVSLVGTPAGLSCSAWPSCLLSGEMWASAVHVGLAGLLVLSTAGLLVVTAVRRPRDRRALGATAAAMGLLAVMAAMGTAFATGRLSPALAPIQWIWLGGFAALLGWRGGIGRGRGAAVGPSGATSRPDGR